MQVGFIATPVLEHEVVVDVGEALGEALGERFPGVDWVIVRVRNGLLHPPAPMPELVDAARRHLLDRDWDLAVAVTDLPLRLYGRPLVKHSSPTHGVGLVSLPALGARHVRQRLLESLSDVVALLVRERDEPAETQSRLEQLAREAEDGRDTSPVFFARVISGNIGLLLGMIRSNHPWRFATRLSRALSGAIATGAFALITSDVWRIADKLSGWRLVVLTVGTIAIAVATLIAVHDLWERAADPRVRGQVVLFNAVTAITIAFGIATLYVALFAMSLAGAVLLISPTLFNFVVHHPGTTGDYLRLAWFTASLATVGGTLGGTLESDQTVREAAYAYRGDDEELAVDGDAGGLATDLQRR